MMAGLFGWWGKRNESNRKNRREPIFEASALEQRLFLAAQPPLSVLISTFSWAKVNPQLEALTIQSEQSDPRFAMLFNADFARAGLPPIPAAAPVGSVAPSLVVRTGEHLLRKPLTHKPAVHKPKPHRPVHKLHKPLHKPAFAAEPRSVALGADANAHGVFGTNIVDLHARFQFSDAPADHSAEFHQTESQRQSYWNAAMLSFGLTPWSNTILGL